MSFDSTRAKEIAEDISDGDDEKTLVDPFVEICTFLSENPDAMSWRGTKPSINSSKGIVQLATKYFQGYRKSDFPVAPSTVPDEMVSVIMEEAYGYSSKECERIKIEHQHAMCAENCVGNLLERYLDSKLRGNGWYWCCGEFVKAVDFLGRHDGGWAVLQVKNRNNSENSSSSAIRMGTEIQKWFRSYSRDTKRGRPTFTNWHNLPPLMQGYGMNEEGFRSFVSEYISAERKKQNIEE